MNFGLIVNIVSIILPLFLATSNTLFKGKMKYVVAIAAYFILKKWAVAAAEDKAGSGLDGGYNNANALATQYKQAMNPTGSDYLIEVDGTNEEKLYELAGRTKGLYKGVFDSYKIQFKRDLTKDLINELSADEYGKFLSILNG